MSTAITSLVVIREYPAYNASAVENGFGPTGNKWIMSKKEKTLQVISLLASGTPKNEIAEVTKFSIAEIEEIAERARVSGMKTLQPKIPAADRQEINNLVADRLKQMKKQGKSLAEASRAIEKEFSVRRHTVSNISRQHGIYESRDRKPNVPVKNVLQCLAHILRGESFADAANASGVPAKQQAEVYRDLAVESGLMRAVLERKKEIVQDHINAGSKKKKEV
jgi:transposase